MSLAAFLILLLIGALCGIAAQMITGYSVGGFLASAVLGFLGAFFGTWLARELHFPSLLAVNVGGYTIEIIWAILGAVLLILLLSAFRRRYYVGDRWVWTRRPPPPPP